MARLWKGELPVSKKAMEITKKLLSLETSPKGYSLSGKNGLGLHRRKSVLPTGLVRGTSRKGRRGIYLRGHFYRFQRKQRRQPVRRIRGTRKNETNSCRARKVLNLKFSEAITELSKLIHSESLIGILIVLALSFLIGFEREERHRKTPDDYSFGGVRTFPLVGLCGYLLARLSQGNGIAIAIGVLLPLASFSSCTSYRKRTLELSSNAGMTSEVSALFTYLLGAFVYRGAFWEATALTVAALLFLELKTSLERLAKKLPASEILTFTRFLPHFGGDLAPHCPIAR